MAGLALVDDLSFVRTMQSINATVRSAPLAVIFFGPLPLLVIAALVHLRRPAVVCSSLPRRWSMPGSARRHVRRQRAAQRGTGVAGGPSRGD
jgi:hypothetical protein